MAETQFDFEVRAPASGREGTFNATVHIPVETPDKASAVLHYIRSIQIRNDFVNGWIKDNAPGYGVSIHGGPRPIFNVDGDRDSGVNAYEQDFRLTRPV